MYIYIFFFFFFFFFFINNIFICSKDTNMDWTTGLRPISSPLLGTLHKNKFTTNTHSQY